MVDFGKSQAGEPLHPGRILLAQAMEPLGISRNQLARDIDVPVGRISDITNGKRGITADTALRLGRYFGTGPELWMRLQAEFDLYVARMTTWPSVEARVRVLRVEQGEAVGTADVDYQNSPAEVEGDYKNDPVLGRAPDSDIEAENLATEDWQSPSSSVHPDDEVPAMVEPVAEALLNEEHGLEGSVDAKAPVEPKVLAVDNDVSDATGPKTELADDDDTEEDLAIPPMPGQSSSAASN